MRPFGYSLMVDLYNCNPKTMYDVSLVYDFLVDAVKTLGVHQQAPPYVFVSPAEFPDKVGISSWIPLIESGIQCHTLAVTSFVSIDYYTCSVIDEGMKSKLIDLAKLYFQPEEIETNLILRGRKYYDRKYYDRKYYER